MILQRGTEPQTVTLLEATSFSSYLPRIHAPRGVNSVRTMARHQTSFNNVSIPTSSSFGDSCFVVFCLGLRGFSK